MPSSSILVEVRPGLLMWVLDVGTGARMITNAHIEVGQEVKVTGYYRKVYRYTDGRKEVPQGRVHSPVHHHRHQHHDRRVAGDRGERRRRRVGNQQRQLD
jgi:hypothetical protein